MARVANMTGPGFCCCAVDSHHEFIDTNSRNETEKAPIEEPPLQKGIVGAVPGAASSKAPVPPIESPAIPREGGSSPSVDPPEQQAADIVKARAFTANLKRREGEEWGLQLDVTDGRVMFICSVAGGETPTGRYNALADPERKLQAGDYITAMNGQMTSKEASENATATVRAHLSYALALKLRIVGPMTFDCEIEKNGMPLGVQLAHSNKGGGLLIADIEDGAAVQLCAPKIQVGDRIVGVSGVESIEFSPAGMAANDTEKLLDALRKSGNRVSLQISRPNSGPATEPRSYGRHR